MKFVVGCVNIQNQYYKCNPQQPNMSLDCTV